jgi:hypothetical protein
MRFEPRNTTHEPSFQGFGQRERILSNLKLISTHHGYSLATYYAAVYYVDAILSHTEIPDEYVHLFTYCCCMIAAKVSEPQIEIPLLESAVEFFQGTCSAQMIKDMENYVLQELQYKLITHTSYSIAVTLLGMGVVNAEEVGGQTAVENAFLEAMEGHVFEFVELMHFSYFFNRFRPAQRTLLAIACARRNVGLSFWSPHLLQMTGVDWESVRVEVEMFVEALAELGSPHCGNMSSIFGNLDPFGGEQTFKAPPTGSSWQQTAPSKANAFSTKIAMETDRENQNNNVSSPFGTRFSTQLVKNKPNFANGVNKSFSSIANSLNSQPSNSRTKNFFEPARIDSKNPGGKDRQGWKMGTQMRI